MPNTTHRTRESRRDVVEYKRKFSFRRLIRNFHFRFSSEMIFLATISLAVRVVLFARSRGERG